MKLRLKIKTSGWEIICWVKRGWKIFEFKLWKNNILKKLYAERSKAEKIMEKLNRAQKCSNLGPQNLGSRGGGGPPVIQQNRMMLITQCCTEYIIFLSKKSWSRKYTLIFCYVEKLSHISVLGNFLFSIQYNLSVVKHIHVVKFFIKLATDN